MEGKGNGSNNSSSNSGRGGNTEQDVLGGAGEGMVGRIMVALDWRRGGRGSGTSSSTAMEFEAVGERLEWSQVDEEREGVDQDIARWKSGIGDGVGRSECVYDV